MIAQLGNLAGWAKRLVRRSSKSHGGSEPHNQAALRMSWWARRRCAFAHPAPTSPGRRRDRSMQPEHAVDGAQFSRLDQLGVRDADRVERSVQPGLPELKKILQRRKFRKQIVTLPDVSL